MRWSIQRRHYFEASRCYLDTAVAACWRCRYHRQHTVRHLLHLQLLHRHQHFWVIRRRCFFQSRSLRYQQCHCERASARREQREAFSRSTEHWRSSSSSSMKDRVKKLWPRGGGDGECCLSLTTTLLLLQLQLLLDLKTSSSSSSSALCTTSCSEDASSFEYHCHCIDFAIWEKAT